MRRRSMTARPRHVHVGGAAELRDAGVELGADHHAGAYTRPLFSST